MGTKGDRTFSKIIEASMESLARFGDRATTFQTIADLAGVSQPLVAKYFQSRDAVLPAVIDKFLNDAVAVTVAAVSSVKSPKQKLRAYLRVSVEMFRDKPEIFKIYLLLHYYAGFEPEFKKRNSEIKRVAVERVAQFIEDGIKEGVFKKCNSKRVAKVIHSSLVGVILGITTEEITFSDLQLQRTLESMILSWIELKE